jgi:uncharacterized protein YegP (UPF0339 family)
MTFHIFRRFTFRGRRWFWHLKARNHEIVCAGQSSGYANRKDVLKIIDKVVAIDAAEVVYDD